MTRRGNPVTKADGLFSRIVRSRGLCEACGARENLQCAHIISRRYRSIRWCELNAFCLCASCHLYFTHHPIEWEVWVVARLGQEWWENLRTAALRTNVRTRAVDLLPTLEERLREVGG